ncbi:unnamed protein product [Lactuca saligna]|uniref:Uncharacterized protein n=1 Tax=Lactuca saligna TaxID=75948 RepID=A0AA35V492_LACSI|nr:unnamed protein product [Lactuca saligna]
MLLSVEGGGFFSSSALGYSKGLTLLLLGKKTKETPMRVTPWNQYQLVDQESDSDLHQSDSGLHHSDSGLHLASNKNRIIRGCASYLCFGRAAAGLDSPCPLKVGPTHHHHQDLQDPLKSPDLEKVKEKVIHLDVVDDDDDDDINVRNTCLLRNSLRRPARTISVSVAVDKEGENEGEGKHVQIQQNEKNGVDHIHKQKQRRVQWTDVSGGDLFMVREFEPSEHSGSDDEYDNGIERSCSCRLM